MDHHRKEHRKNEGADDQDQEAHHEVRGAAEEKLAARETDQKRKRADQGAPDSFVAPSDGEINDTYEREDIGYHTLS